MHVSNSGGPIHDPHKEVMQLFTGDWFEAYESWTIYRHELDIAGDGKVVHKVWEIAKDKERFRALGDKEAPKEWYEEPNVVETTLVVPSKWVSDLEDRIESMSIRPICGEHASASGRTLFRIRFWRGDQESKFSWREPAKPWKVLGALFSDLEKELQQKLRTGFTT